jgi:three-Cys-motif partner protein
VIKLNEGNIQFKHTPRDVSTEKSFFKGKRPWSKIKDSILGQYMTPYLRKVALLGKKIILIDAFAGPGEFQEEGLPGSPLIMCRAAEQHVPSQYLGIFVNCYKEHHRQLSSVLSSFIEHKKAILIRGTAQILLEDVINNLEDKTVFLYLDPFGLKDCEFSMIEPFLRRDKSYSTEIVINLSVPTMHRLSTCRAVAEGRADTPQIRAFHARLSAVLGGEYWKEYLWDEMIPAEVRAEKVMRIYRELILGLDKAGGFSGSCPVREREGKVIKYYVTFYSRHQDAMFLMNDIMCRAYQQRMHEAATNGTLFENTNWKDTRDISKLEDIIFFAAKERPKKSRKDLWLDIIQIHFMQFLEGEYKKTVKKLVKRKILLFEDVRGTRRLNDDSKLYLSSNIRN